MCLSVTPAQIIDPAQSSVNLTATKVEIKMKKDELMTWPKLHIPPKEKPQVEAAPVQKEEDEQDSLEGLDIDAVDLSDL